MDANAIIKLALDLKKGVQSFSYEDKTYNAHEAVEVLRDALVMANGGSAKVTYKSMRRNKVDLFEIIEELVPSLIVEGLRGDEFWTNFVDEKNLKLGDKNEFVIPAKSVFIVAEMADGIATPRRQRIGEETTMSVSTSIHGLRIYEEFTRFMAGRIDWNDLCTKVADAFQEEMWMDVYTAFTGISSATTGLSSTYVKTGSADEGAILTLVDHVEAATGKAAVIFGTRTALRKIPQAVISDSARDAYMQEGYYGKFNGVPMVALKQRHKAGTDTFYMADDAVYIVSGDEQFIKFVNEGETTVKETSQGNTDLSIEYLMLMKWGVAVYFTGRFGKYTFSA